MRGVLRLTLVLALCALPVLGLSACGGGDSEGSTPSSGATTGQESTATTTGDQGPGERERDAGDDSGSGKGTDDSGSGEDSGDGVSGDASPGQEGSASFRTPGGDNSIQNFGEEAGAPDVAAATAVLASYLQAREAGDWAKQCTLLARAAVAPLEQLAARAPQLKGKGCAGALVALMGSAPASERANPMTGGIASLRLEGNRGFALFHGTGGTDYFVQMTEEDGKWKVGAIAPNAFP